MFKRKYIIAVNGGLGNQMLYYAYWYYLKYKKKQKAILYPVWWYLNDHNGFELNQVFKNTQHLHKTTWWLNLYLKLCFYLDYKLSLLEKYTSIHIGGNILTKLPVAVYWLAPWKVASYTFLEEMKDDLPKIFTFKQNEDPRNIQIKRQMLDSNSVSIHVRRGDFQSNAKWRMLLGDICSIDYYQKAIALVRSKFENPVFFIFSDDINWVQENLNLPDAQFVSWNSSENSFRDLELMTYCKVNVVANSSFSLIATSLNVNKNALRIAPLKCRNEYKEDIKDFSIFKDWIHIDNVQPNISLVAQISLNTKQINTICKQLYTDFELILFNKKEIKDARIKPNGNIPIGNHLIHINNQNIQLFKDRKYIDKLLYSKFHEN